MAATGENRWPPVGRTECPLTLRKLTPEQRAERTRQSARQNMFAVQMFDPPEPRPYKEPSVPPDDKGAPCS